MTLPAAFPLSASQINIELGRAGSAAFNIQGAEERALAGVPSGPISFSDFLGKSSRGITLTDNRQTPTSGGASKTYTACATGSAQANSRIVVMACHGDINTNPGLAPTATIGGNAMARKDAHSTGDDTSGSDAVGTAIFEYDGTSLGGNQDIVISWGGVVGMNIAILVLRMVGYSWAAPVFAGTAGTSFDGDINFSVPTNGALFAIAGSGQNAADIVWSGDGIIERGQDVNFGNGVNNVRSWAWITELAADASFNVHMTPASNAQGGNSWSLGSLAPL